MADAAELVLAMFLMILLTSTSVVANGCVFMAFYRNRHVRTVENYLFLTLSFGNIMVGLFYPLQCLVDVGILKYRPACLPIAFILLTCALLISWTILALTMERYLIITRPLDVQRILSERRIAGVISLIILYATVGGAVVPAALSANSPVAAPSVNTSSSTGDECRLYMLVPSQGYRLFYLANRVLSIPVSIGIYLRIFFVARRHMRAIAVQVSQPIPQALSISAPRLREQQHVANWKREIKLTLLVFAIALYQSLCWIPQTALLLQGQEIPSLYYILTHFFAYSSTTVYPIIYGIGNRDIREALINLFSHRNQMH